MTRGLSDAQLGVTEAMIETYGAVVFRLSNNVQHRRGDPIRELDLEAVEASRAELGMSDGQIAARIGLTEPQVTYLRNLEEVRRMRVNNFQRLLDLGGARRFRVERFVPHEERPSYSQRAIALRAALAFPPAAADRFIAEGWWNADTPFALLERWADATPERPALTASSGTTTWAALRHRVLRLARGLHRLGVRAGEVVGVQLPNGPEHFIAYLAIARLGAVMTTLYLPHRASELETILGHSRAVAFIGPARLGDFAPGEAVLALVARGRLSDLEHVIVDAGDADVPGGAHRLAALGGGDADDRLDVPPPVAADPLLLLYTSGTTARPKAVPHSAHTVLSNARLALGEHRIGAHDVILCAASFGHLFGLYGIHLALAAGATTALLPTFSPPALAEVVETLRPSVLLAAPAHVLACLQARQLEHHDFGSLRLAILSGAAVPPAAAEGLAANMPAGIVTQLWGMTETQAGAYTRPSEGSAAAARGAGRASPGTELAVVDEAARSLPPGEEGELRVRGPLLFPGYLGNEPANREAFADDGWFRTGDLARLDRDGALTITGRTKELINRGGVKYNPRDVEALLESHPGVAAAAIVPVPDALLGERACCFVVAASDPPPDLAALCEFLRARGIAKTKFPEQLELVPEMPLTPTRKIIKSRLAAGLVAGG